jgi:hypothetical protein
VSCGAVMWLIAKSSDKAGNSLGRRTCLEQSDHLLGQMKHRFCYVVNAECSFQN